jgi:vancomycin resistance protein YoaR
MINEEKTIEKERDPRKSYSMVRQILFAFGVGAILAFLVLAAALWKFERDHAQTIYPGVSVAGVDLSGLTLGQAVVEANASLNYGQTGQIQFVDGQNRWVYSPEALGFSYNPIEAVNEAFAVGRGKGTFKNLNEQLLAMSSGINITPGIVYDQAKAYQVVQELALQSNIEKVEPAINLETSKINVVEGKAGRTVDINATLTRLQAYFLIQQNGVVNLVVEEHIPVTANVEDTASLAETILSQPFTILSDDPANGMGPWVIEPESLAELLIIDQKHEQGRTDYQLTLNRPALVAYVASIAPSLRVDPVNARMMFNDDTRQLELVESAVIGKSVDVDASVDDILEKIQSGDHQTTLVMETVDPQVRDDSLAADLGITELVAETTSYFHGSDAARIQNIRVSAESFYGVMVAPGEVFSMAKYLTNISLDNGYAEAPIIVGDQTVDGVGGGICQVSTTLFRNAFFGGFPIVERHAHAYRVSYYEQQSNGWADSNLAGLDATVYVPLVDFKFRNDTPYWLLMETYPTNTSLTWKFYSTKDGRSVSWWTSGITDVVSPPEDIYREDPTLPTGEIRQVDWAVYGATAIAYRTVTRDGVVFINDTIKTVYTAWPAGYSYGPGTDIP